MPDLVANPQDIADLRNALLQFAERQQDTFEQIDAELRRMLADFDESIARQRYRVQTLNDQALDCQREAAYAAAYGSWLDCSPIQWHLERAERRLARLIRAQDQLEREWDHYGAERARLRTEIIEHDLPRAVRYLEAVLNGVEAYLEVRLDLSDESALRAPMPSQTQQFQPTLDQLMNQQAVKGDVHPLHTENREQTPPENHGRRI